MEIKYKRVRDLREDDIARLNHGGRSDYYLIDARPHCTVDACEERPYGPCPPSHKYEVWSTPLSRKGPGDYDPTGESFLSLVMCGALPQVIAEDNPRENTQ